jgi:glycosyltransferase involved in cell wall biosynthesis
MRILQVHNKYRPGWGGEETVVALEADLLRSHGHEVEQVFAWTKELDGASSLRLFTAGLGTVWSLRGYSLVKKAIERFSPDIIHAHNTFPLLSPSVFWAAGRARVPVVHTLHNFRMTCAGSLLLRNDQPCENCVGFFAWSGLRHRCFGSSLPRTAAVTAMNIVHGWLGTYRAKVHAYIVLTPFSKLVMTRAGLPEDRIFVKPNFIAAPNRLTSLRIRRVVFTGRIVRSKGAHLLLEAWSRVAPRDHQLLMVGDGPDRAELERRYAAHSDIVWHGHLPREKVLDLVAESRWLVLASLAYENFPMSVLEALSAGTPVIVPNHGAFSSMVSDGVEGLHFSAGDASSLATALQTALDSNEAAWTTWSANARARHLSEYMDRSNYAQLMSIYEQAAETLQRAKASSLRTGIAAASNGIINDRVREP